MRIYMVYGRWLKTWGIDPKAKTPAYTHEDGQDYVPTKRLDRFSHPVFLYRRVPVL